ncbi:uncharacterized protein RCO7_07006 [Rhynchosporium graminicola]|uniref:Uncharacterized protein n=1 Tax=Rhynchosporium graminicola TaxID=2792576 RepID=A0A1E1K0L9_9HELO|nr:uncharacterized protein RCO7_07006 [Rhynchosporium commune]
MAEFYHLYDLPLDIFKTLLDNIVESIVIHQLFAHEIPGAPYRSPGFTFPNNSADRSAKRVLGEFILFRTLADGKRYWNLSARLHRILEVILPGLDHTEENYHTALKALVAVVADAHPGHGPVRLMDCTNGDPLLDETFRSDYLKITARPGSSQIFDEIVIDARKEGIVCIANLPTQAFGQSLLINAAGGGQLSLVVRIMDARTSAGYIMDNYELTIALRASILGDHQDTVNLLLAPKNGYVEYSIRLPRNSVCLPKYATSVNRVDIFNVLCKRLKVPKIHVELLVEAAYNSHIDFVKLCLANGADVNELLFQKGWKLLLAAGARPTDYTCRWHSLTAAAQRGHHEIVADLLAADVVPAHHGNWNPLVTSCNYGQSRAVEVLLDSGVELWYKERALGIAARRGSESIVRLLVSRGAEIDGSDCVSHGSEPPMKEAMSNVQQNVVRVLGELEAKDVNPS